MGEVVAFRRPGDDFCRLENKLNQLKAQVSEAAAKYETASERLNRAAKRGQRTLEYLGSLYDATERTIEFCRRCHDAGNIQDLAVMIEQRDLLARELAERQRVRTRSGV
jgi:hypothetical protein